MWGMMTPQQTEYSGFKKANTSLILLGRLMNAIPAPKYRVRKLAKAVILIVSVVGFFLFMSIVLNSVDLMDFLTALRLI